MQLVSKSCVLAYILKLQSSNYDANKSMPRSAYTVSMPRDQEVGQVKTAGQGLRPRLAD